MLLSHTMMSRSSLMKGSSMMCEMMLRLRKCSLWAEDHFVSLDLLIIACDSNTKEIFLVPRFFICLTDTVLKVVQPQAKLCTLLSVWESILSVFGNLISIVSIIMSCSCPRCRHWSRSLLNIFWDAFYRNMLPSALVLDVLVRAALCRQFRRNSRRPLFS